MEEKLEYVEPSVEDKMKSNLEETEKLILEYRYLNNKIYGRNGRRMDEIEKILYEKNSEFFNLLKKI